jgi:hypothetical protein
MRPSELRVNDPTLQKVLNDLRVVLVNISTDNMKIEVVEGETSATPDAQRYFKHATGSVPALCIPLEGDVYIPKNGRDEQRIDVRSRLASHKFTMLVVR